MEHFLTADIENERSRRPAEDVVIDHVIDALNEFHEKHGLVSDEFSNL